MKKNLILATAFLFAAKLATAQTDKGTQNLGISVSLNHSNTSGTELYYPDNTLQPNLNKFSYYTAGLTYSYFIAYKLDIGAELTYGHTYSENLLAESGQSQTNNSYGGEVFIRKYLMCSSKFGFRAGPYLGYDRTNDSYFYTSYVPGNLTKTKDNYVDAGARLDLVYYPFKRLGMAAELLNFDYSHDAQDAGSNGKSTTNGFSAQVITNQVTASLFYIF